MHSKRPVRSSTRVRQPKPTLDAHTKIDISEDITQQQSARVPDDCHRSRPPPPLASRGTSHSGTRRTGLRRIQTSSSRSTQKTDKRRRRRRRTVPHPSIKIAQFGASTQEIPSSFVDTDANSTRSSSIPRRSRLNIDQVAAFWECYNKAADAEDREFVKTLWVNLDALLIFAGLFSGVNTAFILESLRTLQPDRAETTNDLLRILIATAQNTTTDSMSQDKPFKVTLQALRCTAIFFVSLCCSITAAFGAVLGKQWLNYYEREGGLKPPPDRARERQRKYEARDQWLLEGVIEMLPTILQVSLFLFLIALVDFLWPVNAIVGSIVLAFSLVPILFHAITTILATLYPTSPFQTRLSLAIRESWTWLSKRVASSRASALETLGVTLISFFPPMALFIILMRFILWCLRWITNAPPPTSLPLSITPVPSSRKSELGDVLNLGSLVFLMQRTSTPHDINAILAALNALPVDLKVDAKHPTIASLAQTIYTFLLKPDWDSEGNVTWGISQTDFYQLLNVFYLLYVRWSYRPGYRLAENIEDRTWHVFALRVEHSIGLELWRLFSLEPMNQESIPLISDIIVGRDLWSESSETDLECLCQCLERPADIPLRLAHVRLLAYVLIRSPGRSHFRRWFARFRLQRIMQALVTTIWIDDKPDLDFWRGWIRLLLLPMRLNGDGDKYRFSKYLLEWRTSITISQNIGSSLYDPISQYLKAICTILYLQPNSQFWPQQFEQDGHISYLLDTMDDCTSVKAYWYPTQPALRDAALYCFITLWHRRRQLADASEVASIYMARSSVESIIVAWARKRLRNEATWNTLGEELDKSQLATMMEHFVLFFEEASSCGLIGSLDRMDYVVEEFKLLGDQFFENNPGRQQALFNRMYRLIPQTQLLNRSQGRWNSTIAEHGSER